MHVDFSMNLASVVAILTVTVGVTKLLSEWMQAHHRKGGGETSAMLSQLTDLFREMKTDLREVRGVLRSHSKDHRSLASQGEQVLSAVESTAETVVESHKSLSEDVADMPNQVVRRLQPHGARSR